jgi:hypothetical protein
MRPPTSDAAYSSTVDNWLDHLTDKPLAGWTLVSETVRVSWLDADDQEHERTLIDGREACDLIEAIRRKKDLLLTGCNHRSKSKIAEGPRRVRVLHHACTRIFLYTEFTGGAGNGSSCLPSGH